MKRDNIFEVREHALKNTLFLASADSVPDCLLQDGSVELTKDNTHLKMWHANGLKPDVNERPFPLVIYYEKSNYLANRKELCSGMVTFLNYSVLPIDNAISVVDGIAIPGKYTFNPSTGACFSTDSCRVLRASLVDLILPDFDFGNCSLNCRKGGWELLNLQGHSEFGKFGQSIWLENAPGDISIIDINSDYAKQLVVITSCQLNSASSHPSVYEYFADSDI